MGPAVLNNGPKKKTVGLGASSGPRSSAANLAQDYNSSSRLPLHTVPWQAMSTALHCASQQGVLSGLTGRPWPPSGLCWPANFFQQELRREDLSKLQGLHWQGPHQPCTRAGKVRSHLDTGQVQAEKEQAFNFEKPLGVRLH